MSEADIQSCVDGYDVVLPVAWSVKEAGWKDVRSNYVDSEHHFANDLITTENVIKDIYPEDLQFFSRLMSSTQFYSTNMFVMRKSLFDEYCSWLFTILAEVEKRTDISHYNQQERRVYGYLAERLFGVWVLKIQQERPELRFKYLNRVFVHDTNAKNWVAPRPNTTKPLISTIIASDDNYVPHLAALIKSIQHHFSSENFLDLIILDGGISEFNRNLLKKMTEEHNSSSISFIELEGEFSEHQTHMHFTKATFYRLILNQLIQDREKLLYIDCDTIVLDDIAKLYYTDLNGMAIGAVFDYIMHHFCQEKVSSIYETGAIESKNYLQSYVGMGDNWSRYFQAGVLLIDMNQLLELNLSSKMVEDLLNKTYWFLDQDILNKYFQGRVKFLDPRWNFVNCGDEIHKGLSKEQISELQKAGQNPAIIHYAGYHTKPWNNMGAAYSEYYFQYLRQTFWYEKVVFKHVLLSGAASQIKKWKRKIVKGLWTSLPKSIRRKMKEPKALR